MEPVSPNFDFLGTQDAQLVHLGALAERYFKDDPNTCLIKLRQFGEALAQLTAAKAGLLASPDEPQADLLRRPFAPPDEQAEIVERIEAAFEVMERISAETGHATNLLDRLDQATLRKAFRGELVGHEVARTERRVAT
jgi:hypothetical protein